MLLGTTAASLGWAGGFPLECVPGWCGLSRTESRSPQGSGVLRPICGLISHIGFHPLRRRQPDAKGSGPVPGPS